MEISKQKQYFIAVTYPQAIRSFYVTLILVFSLLLPTLSLATVYVAGDLAPRGAPDGQLNVADIAILQRFILGDLTPTHQDILIGDVAPLNNPDGVLNVADVAVLMRAVQGAVSLQPVIVTAAAPVLDSAVSPTNDNPYLVTGTATPNIQVNLYSGNQKLASAPADANGVFQISAALLDGVNQLHATAFDGGYESTDSNIISVNYQNTIPRTWNSRTISSDTVWTLDKDGTPTSYSITGTLTVGTNATLTLQPGVTLEFGTSAQLQVQPGGSLVVQGSANNNVVFTSSRQKPGSWNGLVFNSTSTNSIVDNALIEWATTGIEANGVDLVVSNSTFREFSINGIYYHDGATGEITNNKISNSNRIGDGISLDTSSPIIKGNDIQNTKQGIYINSNSSPIINNGNHITNNNYGIVVNSNNKGVNNPYPVVTGNSIYENGIVDSVRKAGRDYHARNFGNKGYGAGTISSLPMVLTATGNWWGTMDTTEIANRIYDRSDRDFSPIVNYEDFLDSPGGNNVSGNYLYGQVNNTLQPLQADTVYIVIATISIPAGTDWTIPAGVQLLFTPNAELVVDGNLIVNGVQGNEVLFSSAKSIHAISDWQGIELYVGATLSMNYAVVEYAQYGIYFSSASGTINNSLIQHNKTGVYITGSYIPDIPSHVITNNRIVYNSGYGIRIIGTNVDATNPQPVITDNDIYGNNGNTSYELYVSKFGPNSKIILVMSGNWWGTDTPVDGTQIVHSYYDTPVPGSAFIDYSNYATAPLLNPVFSAFTISEIYISPNADGDKDTTLISASINVLVNWMLTITDTTNSVIRSFSGTGTRVNRLWDGKNASGQAVVDGVYRVVIQATDVATGKTVHPPVSGMVTVNTLAPTAIISFPSNTGIVSDTISINGTAKNAINKGQVTYTVDYAPTASPGMWTVIQNGSYLVINANLATWTTNSYHDQVLVPNGTYLIRLKVRDTSSGMVATDQVTVTLNNMLINNVARTNDVINFSRNETATINFDTNQLAGVTVRIIPESSALKVYPDQTPEADAVRTISMGMLATGRQTISWDGRDDAGNSVKDGAYIYVIGALSPVGRFDKFNAYGPPISGLVEPVIDSASITPYDPYKNKFISFTFNSQNTAFRGSFRIQYTDGLGQLITLWPVYQAVWPSSRNSAFWDGRDDNGNIVTDIQSIEYYISAPGTSYITYLTSKYRLKTNYIVVQGGKPDVPGISLKSDPYIIYLSYGQVTQLQYTLADAADVTVMVKEPVTGIETVLLNNVPQTVGNQTVPWEGQGNDGALVPSEGHYTFTITATNPATGLSTVRRGNISVFQ